MASRQMQALISKLWPGDPESQKIATGFAERFGDANFVQPMLHEAARLDGMIRDGSISREDAQGVLTGFVEMGAPPHVVAEINRWSGEVTTELATAEPPAEPGKPAAEPPRQPPAPAAPSPSAGPTRDQLQQEVRRWEAAMRAPEGSEEWRSYWKNGGSQAYGAALQALEAADTAPPPTLADGEASAASQPTGSP